MGAELAYGQVEDSRLTAGVRFGADRRRRLRNFLRLLGAELARIPDYQNEAERLAQVLRARHSKRRERGGAEVRIG